MSQKKLCAAIATIFCLCIADSLFADEKKPIINTIGMKFVYIPPGKFIMGSSEYDFSSMLQIEAPKHKITLTKGFYIGVTEVTQSQWRAIMGNKLSKFSDCGDDCPVEMVSWNDTQAFIKKLNQKEGTDKYRLPTEAEWEYAARAGTTSAYIWGNFDDCSKANYGCCVVGLSDSCENKNPGKTMRASSFAPNAWGLYDMAGNVSEWVQDMYTKDAIGMSTEQTDPIMVFGSHRILRGGAYLSGEEVRSAYRQAASPDTRTSFVGFRLVRSE